MCGIATTLSKTELTLEEKSFAIKVMKESSIRGVHSFGLSYIVNKKIITKKFHKIEECLEHFAKNVTKEYIFHNRYSTSGDWKEHKNNQPILLNNNSLVFNGVISMKTKEEMEKQFNLKLKTENDGEIFLHHIEKPLQFIDNKNISFAGLYINKNQVFLLRNNLRPMFYSKFNNTYFIASTADILIRSGLSNPEPTKPLKIYNYETLNEQENRLHKLSYPDDEQWGYRPSKHLPALHCK